MHTFCLALSLSFSLPFSLSRVCVLSRSFALLLSLRLSFSLSLSLSLLCARSLSRSDNTGCGVPLCKWLSQNAPHVPSLILVRNNNIARQVYEAGATCAVYQDFLAGKEFQLLMEAEVGKVGFDHSGDSFLQRERTLNQNFRPSGLTRHASMRSQPAPWKDRGADHKDELEDEENDAVLNMIGRFM